MKDYTFENIQSLLQKDNLNLIELNKNNRQVNITYSCPSGHITKSRISQYNNGKRCKECKTKSSPVQNIDQAKEKMKNYGLTLLNDTWENSQQNVSCECDNCHFIIQKPWCQFLKTNKRSCPNCKKINHPVKLLKSSEEDNTCSIQ